VYVAASSKEITRAEHWVLRLRQAGIIVVSTWIDVIKHVGQANPKDATPDEYKMWALKDLGEVDVADVLWLLLPEFETVGAYVELGFAHAKEKPIAMSGRHRPIFTPVLANAHSEYDEAIFDVLIRLREHVVGTPMFPWEIKSMLVRENAFGGKR
jgi:nucleoside 2-deoxyribosyltransferase